MEHGPEVQSGEPPRGGDALIVVDVQRDFLPGGSLAVPDGDVILPLVNTHIAAFADAGLPVVATRDWHPPDHCSFRAQGGPWPPHCVAGGEGADFAAALELPDGGVVIDKGTSRERDAYSAFQGTDLAARLRRLGVTRVFVCGLATDYCVLDTVLDALSEGFEVLLLDDAIRAVNVHAGDEGRALGRMRDAGAVIAGGPRARDAAGTAGSRGAHRGQEEGP